jgi:hypothetical protein
VISATTPWIEPIADATVAAALELLGFGLHWFLLRGKTVSGRALGSLLS